MTKLFTAMVFFSITMSTSLVFACNDLIQKCSGKASIQKKECAAYSGESDVKWRGLTIKPGDIIDVEVVPAEDRLDFYKDVYMSLVQSNEVSFVDCTDSE